MLEAVVDRLGTEALHLNRRLVRVGGRGGSTRGGVRGRGVRDRRRRRRGRHPQRRRGPSAIRSEGPALWDGFLPWRGVTEMEPVTDGRTMIWAGHPEQKFVGYPIADSTGGGKVFNFIAERRRPGPDLAGERMDPQGVPRRLAPPSRVGLRLAGRCRPSCRRRPRPSSSRWSTGTPAPNGPSAGAPCWATLRTQCTRLARMAPPKRYSTPGAGRLHPTSPDDVDRGLATATRRPAPDHCCSCPCQPGPRTQIPMKLVEERAPEGFADIADVITPKEIAEVTEEIGGRRASHSLLSSGASRCATSPTVPETAPGSVRLRLRTAPRDTQSGTRASPSSSSGVEVPRKDHRGGLCSEGGFLEELEQRPRGAVERPAPSRTERGS